MKMKRCWSVVITTALCFYVESEMCLLVVRTVEELILTVLVGMQQIYTENELFIRIPQHLLNLRE